MRTLAPLPLLLLSLAGCTLAAPSAELTGEKASAVLGGTTDDTHKGVVAVVNAVDLCTGFTIAPDLVLTARHCAGALVNPTSPCVAADGGTAVSTGTTFAPTDFEVYSATDLAAPGQALAVAEVLVPPESTLLCGNDVALLRLVAPVDPALAIAPRIDAPPSAGEAVTVIGYGASQGGPDTTSGVRRMREGLTVSKLGPQLPRFVDGEWTISEGPCAGDSGSPALDAQGRAIGVMSRGSKATCVDMIYERVDVHAAWLRDQARASYMRAGAPMPTWIDAGTSGAGGAGGGGGGNGGGGGRDGGGGQTTTAVSSSTGGCAVGAPVDGLGEGALIALAALLSFSRRTRRASLRGSGRA